MELPANLTLKFNQSEISVPLDKGTLYQNEKGTARFSSG